jgi:tripartite-type tricarboxylate transporter receptor subunit TctC
MKHRIGSVAAAACVFMVSLAFAAKADSVADFYRGKTLTILISSGAGGGYDALARTLATYLPRHIPGSPTTVVKNMPGAGGIVATNYLYNVAPKDGLVIGGVQNNTPFEPLFGTKEARYDATKFNWLGTPSVETAMLTLWHTGRVKTLDQAKQTDITLGATGQHSTPSFYARLMRETLGVKAKIIVGYESQTQAFLAMERGEIDGYPSVFYSALMTTQPDWLTQKKINILVQLGMEKEKALGNTPFALDLAKNESDRKLMIAAFAPLSSGRPYLTPPGVPGERVAALRKAMHDTFRDPDFVAESERRRLGVDGPRSGEELQALIEQVYSKTPSDVVERLRKLQNE